LILNKEKPSPMNIAFLGTGTMGAPMAINLLGAGHHVTVYNRTPDRTGPVVEKGARVARTPAEAARGAEVVVVCVSDTPDVESVLLGDPDGAIHGLVRGSLVVDCSTISPEATRRIAARFSALGIGYVDAPVSGGSEGAVQGTLAIMCGGSEEDFSRARPVLEAMGTTITHVGPVGSGQVAKAVNQVVIAGVYQSVAEGMVLAARAGVDPERVVAAIRGGAAASWVLENRAGNMLRDAYPLGFRVRLHRKDLGIALETARSAGVVLPTAAYVAEVEDELIAEGYGDDDMSAIARTVRRAAGAPDGPLGPTEE
jgi:3-hydroxyisobutyrate dehydrogenase